jgi:hypothetical protein
MKARVTRMVGVLGAIAAIVVAGGASLQGF